MISEAAVTAVMPADGLWELPDELLRGAECRYDPELHRGPSAGFEPLEARRAREQVAREVCDGCPVQGMCMEYALRVLPSGGVWAGLTAMEVAALAEHVGLTAAA